MDVTEVNVDNLIDNTADYEMIDLAPISNSKIQSYEEVYADEPIISKPKSSIVPLTLTIIFCLAAGIALGIFAAKRTANK